MHTPEAKDEQKEKQPYRTPRLTVYGTVVELTRGSFTPDGALDGEVASTKMGVAFLKSV